MACPADGIEQVVAFERFARDEVRSWIAVDEVPVTGPLDPRLARIAIHSSHVVGLGICAPWTAEGARVAGRIIAVQRLVTTPSGPVSVDVGLPRPITLDLDGHDAAVLYGPPPESNAPSATPTSSGAMAGGGAIATWPAGKYAVAFAFDSDDTAVVRWLRIDLIDQLN